MNILCVCAKCGKHENNSIIEINFREQKIYWLCPKCKKMNEIVISEKKHTPLPRVKTRRY